MNFSQFVSILIYIILHLQNSLSQSENRLANDENLPICNCTFKYTITNVSCSGLGLSLLPTAIPRNTTHLDLSNNDFVNFDNETFLQFEGLRQIKLSGNKLTRIPTFPETIQEIFLNRNKIANFNNDTFLKYNRLEKINLAENKLTKIPAFNENINKIYIDHNPLETIEPYTFYKLKHFYHISLNSNNLKELPENVFTLTTTTNPTEIFIQGKSISKISSGAFKNLRDYAKVEITGTNIHEIPAGMIQGTRALSTLDLSWNKIYHIDSEAFKDQDLIFDLYLNNNLLTAVPLALFNIPTGGVVLDLSWNNISSLGDGPILNKSPNILYLVGNQIRYISKDNFRGFKNLNEIMLFQNKIEHIADGAFRDTKLESLMLQSNRLTHITRETFYIESKKLAYLYIYDNPLKYVEDNALSNMAPNSTTYLKCQNLKKLPVFCEATNIYCVPETTDILFRVFLILKSSNRNRLFGMVCDADANQCTLCKQGHFGNIKHSRDFCYACPPGGFYQDLIGYVGGGISDYTVHCKRCPVGSFSPSAGGRTVADCQTCPRGTKTDMVATLNACECLNDFHRTDRYGPCQLCPVGVDCTDGIQRLKPGYWWSWRAMGDAGSFTAYEKFVSDMGNNTFDEKNPDKLNATIYIGQLPAVHDCLRKKSCRGGGIDGNCSDGYSGWLCAECSDSHYELFNECYPCQNTSVIIAIFVLIITVLSVIGYTVWKLNKRNAAITSFLTHIKITINFYQILGILSEVNEIHWPDNFQSVGQSLQYLDIIRYVNILSPKCIFPGTWNAYTLLYIAIVTPFAIVMLTSVIFCLSKIFYRCKGDYTGHNFKDKFLSVTIMMLYLTYANTCSNIMAVGPWSIRKFNVTADGRKNISKLTSDYSIDVEQDDGVYNIHKNIVYYSLIYVVSFPLIVVVILYFKYKRNNNDINDACSGQSQDFELKFFFKQYTSRFWYWEVFEMYNKAVLALIANFKDDQASNMSYSLFITVVLIALHLYLEPMKNKSDQRFKLLTLCFIIVNLSVGAIVDLNTMLYTEDNTVTFLQDITPFILLLINFSILLLLFVDLIKKIKEDIWDSLKHHPATNNTTQIESNNNDDLMPLVYNNAASYEDGE